MTKACAENGPSNAGSRAGPKRFDALDQFARKNAQLLPPQPAVPEAHRHQYPPLPPEQRDMPQPVFKGQFKANRPKWKKA
jgi:hypothetical protein